MLGKRRREMKRIFFLIRSCRTAKEGRHGNRRKLWLVRGGRGCAASNTFSPLPKVKPTPSLLVVIFLVFFWRAYSIFYVSSPIPPPPLKEKKKDECEVKKSESIEI